VLTLVLTWESPEETEHPDLSVHSFPYFTVASALLFEFILKAMVDAVCLKVKDIVPKRLFEINECFAHRKNVA